MTAIVDKKSVGNSSKPEGDCSLSMPGANGRRGLVSCRQKPLIQSAGGLAHSKTLREIPVSVQLCTSFWSTVPQLRDGFGCSAASEGNDSMRNKLPVAPVIL